MASLKGLKGKKTKFSWLVDRNTAKPGPALSINGSYSNRQPGPEKRTSLQSSRWKEHKVKCQEEMSTDEQRSCPADEKGAAASSSNACPFHKADRQPTGHFSWYYQHSQCCTSPMYFSRVKLFSLSYPSNVYLHPFSSVYEFHTTASTLLNAALLPNIDLSLFSKKVLTEASRSTATVLKHRCCT